MSRVNKPFRHAVNEQSFIATRHALLQARADETSTRAPSEPRSTSTWPIDMSTWDAYAPVVHRWRLPLALVALFGFYWLAGPTRWQGALDVICVLCTYVTLVLCVDIVSDLTSPREHRERVGGEANSDQNLAGRKHGLTLRPHMSLPKRPLLFTASRPVPHPHMLPTRLLPPCWTTPSSPSSSQ